MMINKPYDYEGKPRAISQQCWDVAVNEQPAMLESAIVQL